jgi:hypothetical protein
MINRIGIADHRNDRINEKAISFMFIRNSFACSIKIALIVCTASIALMFPGCSKPDDPNKPTIQKYSPGKIGNSRYKPPTVRLEMLTPEKNQVFKKPKSIECRVRMILDKGDEMPCWLRAQMRFKSKKGYVLYSNGLMDPKIDRDHSDPNTVAYICTVTFKSSEIFKPHQYEAFVECVDDVVYLKPKDKNDNSADRKTEIKSTTLASLNVNFEVK